MDGKDGKMPWGWGRLTGLAAVPLLGATAVVATPWAVDHIEDQLVAESRSDLAAAGIDASGLDIDFDYRDGTAAGQLPAGVEAATIEAAVDHDLLRDFDVTATAGTSPSPVTEDAAPATSSPTTTAPASTDVDAAPATGSTDVNAALTDGRLTLTGEVLSADHRSTLVSAAVGVVGEADVDDQLVVTDLEPTVAGADERVATLAAALAGLSADDRAALQLTDTDLTGTVATSSASTPAALAALAGTDGFSLDIDVDTSAITGPTDVSASRDGDAIVLTGEVLDDAQRDRLVAAAAAQVGADNVDDRVVVSGAAEAVPGADDRVDDLVTAIGALGAAQPWAAQLTDETLTVDATVTDPAAAAELDGLSGSLASVETSVNVTTATRAVDAEITGLQSELDDLADEIRANVVFPPSSAELGPEATATLDKVADAMNRYPLPVVEVVGHTDSDGSAEANLALSEARAAAVEAYLVENGLAPERLSSRGAGETEPIDTNDTAEGRAQNRRVALTALESF